VHKFLCSFANFLIRLRESKEGSLWLVTVMFGLICGVAPPYSELWDPQFLLTYYSARPVSCVSFAGLPSPFLSRCRPEGRADFGPARPHFRNLLTEFQRLHQR